MFRMEAFSSKKLLCPLGKIICIHANGEVGVTDAVKILLLNV